MFKKLKEKITEEVKSSPQLQKLTQTVSDRLQTTSTSDDNNFFSIDGEEDTSTTMAEDTGFTSVPLNTPDERRLRRTSLSSVNSDVSFLPRYESSPNMYHLQSDLEFSEMEDNASTSSSQQVGQWTKEQIYAAFQKAQMRYHKYRGRYTDLAKHYKELERENGKMKSVLVDTQDKAIRRVTELREQCSLEQKAKAHLENALRVELDEKQYKIDTLNTKIELLKSGGLEMQDAETVTERNQSDTTAEESEVLKKQLSEAKNEMDQLNGKLQEMKANLIIFQSKEADYKSKIVNLEKELEISRKAEKEHNFKLTQDKMDVQNEVLVKEKMIIDLKSEIEGLKSKYSGVEKEKAKMEQLQAQNKKLIEKLEETSEKCKKYESQILKLKQLKVENESLKKSLEESEKAKIEFSSEAEKYKIECLELKQLVIEKVDTISVLSTEMNTIKTQYEETVRKCNNEHCNLQKELENNEKTTQELKLSLEKSQTELNEANNNLKKKQTEFDEEISKQRETAKKGLLSLETKIKERLKEEYNQREEQLKQEFLEKINSNNEKQTQLQLLEKDKQIHRLESELENLQELKHKYKELEENHLDLIDEIQRVLQEKKELEKLEVRFKELERVNEEKLEAEECLRKEKEVCGDLWKEIEERNVEIGRLRAKNEELEMKLRCVEEDLSEHVNEAEECLRKERDVSSGLRKEIEARNLEIERLKAENQELETKFRCVEENLSERVNEAKLEAEECLRKEKEVCGDLLKEIEESNVQIASLKAQNEELDMKLRCVEEDLSERVYEVKLEADEGLRKEKEISSGLRKGLEERNVEIASLTAKNEEFEMKLRCVEENLSDARLESINSMKEEKDVRNELTNKLQQREKEIGVIRAELEELKIELGKREENLKSCQEENQRLKERLGEVEKSLEKNHELSEKLQKNINELEIKSEENYKAKSELEKRIEELQMMNTKFRDIETKNSQLEKSYKDICNEKNELEKTIQKLQILQNHLGDSIKENETLKSDLTRLNDELNELKNRNNQISTDNQIIIKENTELLSENEELKIKLDLLETDLKQTDNTKSTLQLELDTLRNENEQLQKSNQPNSITETQYKQLETENRQLKSDLQKTTETLHEQTERSQKIQSELNQLDKHFTELIQEKKLLEEELQELKLTPWHQQENLNGNSIRSTPPELSELREKLHQYQSLDLTNRSSLDYYENEVQRLRTSNEKLSRKLDETLVTLNHCSELSMASTEIEYLRNVLYNYMLGKESLVLARVIAAVCKFDEQQTETVLQKEQQKQTLLGHLGIL